MEDQEQQEDETNRPNHGSESTDQRNESAVRSRWTPKPEQILILESIFNSGMVNPPKDETVRIRKLLEKFGAVGDANVFYWFQNRRSRSRRRQRQIQASLICAEKQVQMRDDGGAIQHETSSCTGFHHHQSMSTYPLVGSSSACGVTQNDFGNELLAFPGQTGHMEAEQTSAFCPSNIINHSLHYRSGFITVFINGVATEIPRGLTDLRAMFGPDFVLFHSSSGVPVSVNEYGFLVEGLQQGESYLLVQRTA